MKKIVWFVLMFALAGCMGCLLYTSIAARKDFELVVLPGQRHGYMGPAKDYYYRKMWRHFARYLLE